MQSSKIPDESPQNGANTTRRLARKRDVTKKKTDEDHPLNKRMKLDKSGEQMLNENSINTSNGPIDQESSNQLSSKKTSKRQTKLLAKDTGSMSFKMNLQGLNSIQERTLKLRRCETENLHPKDLDAEDPFPQSPDDMLNEIMRLRQENNKYKTLLIKKEKENKEKKRVLEIEDNRINKVWNSYAQKS